MTWFSAHGVGIQIEWPNRVLDGGDGTPLGAPRRAGWGTVIRQRAETSNWFHFSLPVAMVSPGPRLRGVLLRAAVNENARIDHIHLRFGVHVWTWAVRYTDQEVYHLRTLDNGPFGGPGGWSLSVHVRFLTGRPLGQVTFHTGAVRLAR